MIAQSNEGTLGDRHVPLRAQVRDELRKLIVTGDLRPGQRIIEREVAESLGVSRVPVREALRILEAEGFVAMIPRRGVIVNTLARADVEDLFDVREALEVVACKLAAARATEAELAGLRGLLSAAREASDRDDAVQIGTFNVAFHEQVVVLAHNKLLASIMEPMASRLRWLFRQTGDPLQTIEEHEELCDAIASGDPEVAGALAVRHVCVNRERVLHLLFD